MTQKDTGIVNIHGKEYQTVASRVQRFREQYKDKYGLPTAIVDRDDSVVVMKASVIRLEDDKVVATGYAEENRTSSQINRTSALENAETSAIGRALANFGMAGTEYASADEVAQAVSQQSRQTAAVKLATPKTVTTTSVPAPANAVPAGDSDLATPAMKAQVTSFFRALGHTDEEIRSILKADYGIDATHPMTRAQVKQVIGDLR